MDNLPLLFSKKLRCEWVDTPQVGTATKERETNPPLLISFPLQLYLETPATSLEQLCYNYVYPLLAVLFHHFTLMEPVEW